MRTPKPRKVHVGLTALARSGCEVYKVSTADRVLLGFLSKQENTATETHPWKAFRPKFVAGSPAQFGDMLDVWYGGKQAQLIAITSLLKAEYGGSYTVGDVSYI